MHDSLIDIGSGDGKRSNRIANALGIKDVTLIDNSESMVCLAKQIKTARVIRADIANPNFKIDRKYGLAFCLWNVLGHIISIEERIIALKNLSGLITSKGFIFLDVNNRYNLSQYGFKSAIRNIFKDIFILDGFNGDFVLELNTGKEIQTTVHLFNPFEIEHLIKLAHLGIIKRQVINYKTGKKGHSIFRGQLVYKLSKI